MLVLTCNCGRNFTFVGDKHWLRPMQIIYRLLVTVKTLNVVNAHGVRHYCFYSKSLYTGTCMMDVPYNLRLIRNGLYKRYN